MDDKLDSMLDTVQCIWEFALEMRTSGTPEAFHPGSSAFHAAVNTTADVHGISAVRAALRSLELLDAVEQGWELSKEKDVDLIFDWEYVPEFLCTCMSNDLSLAKDWKERLHVRLEELESETAQPSL